MRITTSRLYRLAGVALLTGGVLGAGVVAVHPTELTDPLNAPLHLVLYYAVVLVMVGLAGVLARQAEQAGIMGLLGTTLLVAGLSMGEVLHSVLDFSIVPALAADPSTRPLVASEGGFFELMAQTPAAIVGPLTMPLLLLGTLLQGIASLRANVLPRWAGGTLLGGLALVVLGMATGVELLMTASVVVLYLGLAAHGLALAADLSAPVRRPVLKLAPAGQQLLSAWTSYRVRSGSV